MSPLRIWAMADLGTITVESYTGLDAQGMPSYGSSQTTQGHFRRTDAFVVTPDGSRIDTPGMIWIPGDGSVLPDERDRVTVASDEFVGIVMERKENRKLKATRGSLDHVRLKCREE